MRLLKKMLAVASLCIAQFASAQSWQTTEPLTEQYKNNTITFQSRIDTIAVEDPETGAIVYKVIRTPKMHLLNGKLIYDNGYYKPTSEPVGAAAQSDLKSFIKSVVAKELNKIKDTRSSIYMNIVIDEKGKLAYFKSDVTMGETMTTGDMGSLLIDIEEKLSAVTFSPAQKDGKAVPYNISVNGL